ncbi:MAG: hypothetical protein JWS12_363 [Candidatus Saccharibacteria bacterium]|nr:hypothetical protein [Candidatus Saccharibacteria bacterium]
MERDDLKPPVEGVQAYYQPVERIQELDEPYTGQPATSTSSEAAAKDVVRMRGLHMGMLWWNDEHVWLR